MKDQRKKSTILSSDNHNFNNVNTIGNNNGTNPTVEIEMSGMVHKTSELHTIHEFEKEDDSFNHQDNHALLKKASRGNPNTKNNNNQQTTCFETSQE